VKLRRRFRQSDPPELVAGPVDDIVALTIEIESNTPATAEHRCARPSHLRHSCAALTSQRTITASVEVAAPAKAIAGQPRFAAITPPPKDAPNALPRLKAPILTAEAKFGASAAAVITRT